MSAEVKKCPDCEETVVICDNNVRLDYPAEPFDRDPLGACWTIMQLGPLQVASVGDASPEGTGHRLHEHQPPES